MVDSGFAGETNASFRISFITPKGINDHTVQQKETDDLLPTKWTIISIVPQKTPAPTEAIPAQRQS
jgi:hypothetical protein